MHHAVFTSTHAAPFKPARVGLAVSLALALTACGGGGESTPTPVIPVPVVTPSLTLTGTAATGAAVASRPVTAKCATGTGSATTAADGSYSLRIDNGALPCVVRVTLADASTLQGLATGSGAAARANITPVTELVIARLSAGSPAGYFDGFNASAATALTSAAADAATTAVLATLTSAGLSLSSLGNVLNGPLVAINGSTPGDAYDKALDTLKAKLASAGTTLATLVGTVALSAPQAVASALSGTPMVPADALLRTAAASCPALRSGTYRIIAPHIGVSSGADSTGTLVLDAAALTTLYSDGSRSTFVPQAGSPCRFSISGTTGDVTVSQAGVVAAKNDEGKLTLGFLEQNIDISELAGTWNMLGMERDSSTVPYQPKSATATLNASGNWSGINFCADVFTCADVSPAPSISLAVRAQGGFVRTNSTDHWADIGFAYRAGSGEMFMVFVDGSGSFSIWTRQRTIGLPTVGTVSTGWNVAATNNLSALDITDYENTITSVDPTASTFKRNNVFDFASHATAPENLSTNAVRTVARNGYGWRKPETVTGSTGTSRTVSEFISLPLRGMGMTALVLPGSGVFVYSVAKP